jgi:hypothetical protein
VVGEWAWTHQVITSQLFNTAVVSEVDVLMLQCIDTWRQSGGFLIMSINEVIQAQQVYQNDLLVKPNVVGVAVGPKNSVGELSVVVLVQQKLPFAALSADSMVPREVDGVRTDVVEIGYVRAYANPRDRFRPNIPAGISLGHYKITAGTLGVMVTDKRTGAKLILSNNHVLANSNDAQIGDPIIQPGPTDGGINPADVIATLERYIPLRYDNDPDGPPPPVVGGDGGTNPPPLPPTQPPPATPLPPDPITPTPPAPPTPPTPPVQPPPTTNPSGNSGCFGLLISLINGLAALLGSDQRVAPLAVSAQSSTSVSLPGTPTIPLVQAQIPVNEVDCALARPINPSLFTGEILGIGTVSGTRPPALGMKIRKTGRTTGYTEGTVQLLNATVNVAYGARTARFTGQVIATPMSQGGDSGSLIVDGAENKAVGLLFAGSNLSTIFTPIDRVLDVLQVTL